jgi:type II secretory pathway component PulM
MMRTQPPGFRWLVGGVALVAALALGWQYRSTEDRADLVLAVLCLLVAGYWLIFDREPASERSEGERLDDGP